ncbi:MAG: GerMN domain-containing protein [Lachnospiraceae bacterium]
MKKWLELLLLTGLLCLAGGCGSQSGEEESGYRIWYVNQKETRLEYEYKELQAKNTEGLLKEALEVLRESPWDDGYKPVLPENVRIESYTIEHNQLYLDFSAEYMDMPKVYEVLCRAALVRTLCQIPEIDYVGFRIGGQPLMDLNGKAVGLMNEDQFIENAGEEINAYKTADLTLYYANQAGDKLVSQRIAMEYNSNISLEKLIVERLIDGPPFEGAYPTIPEGTKLLSIVVKDGICYVNLDEGFLKTGYNEAENIPIYSIVNSLVMNTDAQKVQISINGETNRMFRESISFDTVFEKNEELME